MSVLRDALLHTTLVMYGYLHYCHLPVSFDQSGPSPLTSLINNLFLPAELLLTGCFFCFSHHLLQTLETVVRENLRSSAVSETALSGTNNHSTVKITYTNFFPIWLIRYSLTLSFLIFIKLWEYLYCRFETCIRELGPLLVSDSVSPVRECSPLRSKSAHPSSPGPLHIPFEQCWRICAIAGFLLLISTSALFIKPLQWRRVLAPSKCLKLCFLQRGSTSMALSAVGQAAQRSC